MRLWKLKVKKGNKTKVKLNTVIFLLIQKCLLILPPKFDSWLFFQIRRLFSLIVFMHAMWTLHATYIFLLCFKLCLGERYSLLVRVCFSVFLSFRLSVIKITQKVLDRFLMDYDRTHGWINWFGRAKTSSNRFFMYISHNPPG